MFKGKLPLLAVSSCMWKTRLIVEKSLSKKIKLQVFVLQTFRIINEMVTIWFRFQIFNMKVKSFPQCLILSIYLLDLLVPTLYWHYGMSTLRENGQFKPKLACFHTFLGIFLGNVDKIMILDILVIFLKGRFIIFIFSTHTYLVMQDIYFEISASAPIQCR